jgi:3(or 17)beta-hydroxysteroid dehydrogenase
MGRVDGKVAIVTGGASGIGAACARQLAREGARVVVTDVDREGGEAVAEEVGGLFVEQDVSLEESWPPLIETTMGRFGSLDVLVNNAGIVVTADIEATTTEDWRRILAVHLDGTFFGCKFALEAMKTTGGGSIVNMASVAALVGTPAYFAYSAAKGGVTALTRTLAMHCKEKRYGIRCNSVHPSSILTPMVARALQERLGLEIMQAEDPEALRVEMGLGEPDDVAHMVVYLASDESRFVTGTQMVVDDGSTSGYPGN